MSNWTTMRACAKEPFFLTWSDFYAKHGLSTATDTITASVWTVTGGTGGVEFLDGNRTGLFLSGGTPGGEIVAKNVIEINGGQYIACDYINVGIV